MAVQYDSKNNTWGGILTDLIKAKNGFTDVSDEANAFFEKYQKNGKNLSNVIANVSKNKDWKGYIKNSKLADQSLIAFLKDTRYATKDLATYQQYLQDTSGTLSIFQRASKTASTVIKSFGATLANMAFAWAISEVFSLIVKGIDNVVHASEKAIERMEKAKSTIADLNSSYENHATLVSESGDRYAELASKIGSLSTDELKEFQELNKQFTDAFPDLITGFDDQGNAIANIGKNAEESKKKLQELLDQEKESSNYKIFENLDDLYDGTKVKLDEAIKQAHSYEKYKDELNKRISSGDAISLDINYKENGSQIRDNLLAAFDDFQKELHNNGDFNLDAELIDTLNSINNGVYDEVTGTQSIWFSLVNWTPEQKDLFKRILENNYSDVYDMVKNTMQNDKNKLNDDLGNSTSENNIAQQEADAAWRDYTSSLAKAMQSQQTFKDIDDSLQPIAISLVENLNRSIYEANGDIDYSWIRDNILNGLLNIDDNTKFKVQSAYKQLLNLNPEDFSTENQQAISNFINKIAILLQKSPLQIRLAFGFNETDAQKDFNTALDKAKKKFEGYSKTNGGEDISNDTGNNIESWQNKNVITPEQIDLWNQAIDSCETYTDAIENYKSLLEDVNNESVSLDTSSAIKKLKELEDSMSSLDEAMASLTKGEKVDLSALDGIRNSFSELEGVDMSKINKCLDKIGNASSVKEAQSAMNALAEEYLNLSGILDGLDESNQKLIANHLKSIGITNADTIVTNQLTTNKQIAENETRALAAATQDLSLVQNILTSGSHDVTDATYQASASFVEESDMTKMAKIELMNLVAEQTIFNAQGLSVADKINALAKLANAYLGVANAKEILESDTKQVSVSGMGKDPRYAATVESAWNNLVEQNKQEEETNYKPQYGGGAKTQKAVEDAAKKTGEAADKVKDAFYSVFDWMEKKIKYLERITEKAIERISDSLQYAMDKSYISNTFKKINEQMATNAYMVQRYKKSADAVGLADEDLKNKIKNGGNIDYYKDHNMHDDFGHVYDEDLNNKITAYADWIDKSLEAAEANETLKKSVKELAETISQAPIDKAANKVEKYDSSTELIEAKVDNYKSAKNKNKQLDIKSSNIDKTLSSYKTAYNTTKSNEKSYEKKITKQKVAKGATNKQKSKFKSLMAKVKSAAKGKKKISDKTLESIYSYCASVKDFTWYQNAVTYNSSIEAMDSAKQTYDLYKQTSKKDKREIAKEKFDNVVTEYDNKIGLIDNGITDIDNKLALTEAKGMLVNTNYYKQQKAIKAEEQSYYQQELQRLQELANGIEKGTQEWYDAQSSIQDCKNSISECTKAQLEYNNAINEADVAKYEKISSLISRTSTEMEFLEKLMSHDKMYDDNGAFTESGIATLGTYAMSYYDNLQNANRDKAELDRLKGMLASGNLGTYNSVEQLQQRIDELYDTWQDDISATYSAQESIFDMMSDKFNAELDALQELVDRRRESLELSKEIFDYQNKISEKTKSINTLQKQIAAYKGDTSQEGRAKLQKLQVSLQDVQKDLRDTEYDKYISDQEKLLDKLLDEFKENIEKRLEDFKKVVNDGLNLANANSADILSHLRSVSSENGYVMQYSPATSTTLQGYINTIVAAINSRTTTAIDNPDTNNGGGDTTFTHPTIPATNEDRRHDAIEKDKLEYANKVAKEQKLVSEYKDKTIAFIKENGKKTSKEPSDAVNKVIYKKYGKKYLSTKQLKNLAKILDVKYDNASKTGNLYQRLQALNVKGFKDGGIAKLIKSKGEDGVGILQNGEGLVAPKHVKSVQELLDLTPLITDMIKVNQPDYTKLASVVTPVKSNIGDVQFNFELNECENAQDIIKQIQTDTKIQNALRSVTTDQMLGVKRSNTNRIK